MSNHARRFALLVMALGIIAVSLVACQTPNADTGSSNTILIPTQNAANLTPTPKFPPFTIGAWPSNFAPDLNDSITIYVVCRVQDQSMQGPSHPPPSLTVVISIGSPIPQQFTARTGADGYATQAFSFNDPVPGQPVIVNVSTTYNGAPYSAQTFFTPGPKAAPSPTAAPSQTPGGGGGGGGGKPTPPGGPPVPGL